LFPEIGYGDEYFMRQSGTAAATAKLLGFFSDPSTPAEEGTIFLRNPATLHHTTDDLDTLIAAFKLLLESALEWRS
jgi:7-keto-8-aminopelargonate synthetase-like enzyme